MQLKHAVPAVAVAIAIALATAGCGGGTATTTSASASPQCDATQAAWSLLRTDAASHDLASLAADLPTFTNDLALIGLSGDGQRLDQVVAQNGSGGYQAIQAAATDIMSKCPSFIVNS